ncbi:hypothetical protein [Microbacterium sp. NPDC089695]|uniref:hypothetical protein n=1 Tax=Microbacterium sp. NPDC089695 TaxID=3364198 RepID=UPI00380C1F89
MSDQHPQGQPQGTPPAPPRHPGQYQGQAGQQGQPHGQLHGQRFTSQPSAYGVPTYSSAATGQQGVAAPGYPGATGARSGAPGRIAFILALVSVAMSVLLALSFPLVVRAFAYSATSIGSVTAVGNILVLAVAIVALVFALMAVRRPGQQILAGIALGIAASEIVGIVVAGLSNLVFSLANL